MGGRRCLCEPSPRYQFQLFHTQGLVGPDGSTGARSRPVKWCTRLSAPSSPGVGARHHMSTESIAKALTDPVDEPGVVIAIAAAA